MPGGAEDGLLVAVVGRSDQDCVHVRTGAEGLQFGLTVATQLFGDGLPVLRVQHGDHPGALLLVEDAAQLGPEIASAHNGVSNGFHFKRPPMFDGYLMEPCARPPAILFWISIKKITEGTTTSAEAAIMTPQSMTSWPPKDLSATATVILSLLFMSMRE